MKQIAARLFHSIAGRYGRVLLDHRSFVVIGTQLTLILAANLSAFELRFDADIPAEYQRIMWSYVPAVLLMYGSGLWVFGIQRGLWRYVGLHDLGRILTSSLVSAMVFYVVVHLLLGHTAYPRSVIILTG